GADDSAADEDARLCICDHPVAVVGDADSGADRSATDASPATKAKEGSTMTHVRRGAIFAAIAILISLHLGCESEPPQPNRPPTTHMRLGQASFLIEIANDDPTREFGLMKRDSMAPDHGMIFVFPNEKPLAFWMKNTRFPLDIAFLDHTG